MKGGRFVSNRVESYRIDMKRTIRHDLIESSRPKTNPLELGVLDNPQFVILVNSSSLDLAKLGVKGLISCEITVLGDDLVRVRVPVVISIL